MHDFLIGSALGPFEVPDEYVEELAGICIAEGRRFLFMPSDDHASVWKFWTANTPGAKQLVARVVPPEENE